MPSWAQSPSLCCLSIRNYCVCVLVSIIALLSFQLTFTPLSITLRFGYSAAKRDSKAHPVLTAWEDLRFTHFFSEHDLESSPQPPSEFWCSTRNWQAFWIAGLSFDSPAANNPFNVIWLVQIFNQQRCFLTSIPNQVPYVKHTAQLPYQLPSSLYKC